MRDSESLPRSIHELALQLLRRSKCHAMHQAMQHSVPRLQLLEQRGDLLVEAHIAHEPFRAWQIRNQILGFLLQPLVLVTNRQLPSRRMQLLRNRPGNTPLVRQPKNHRRLLSLAQSQPRLTKLSFSPTHVRTAFPPHRSSSPSSPTAHFLFSIFPLATRHSSLATRFYETPSQSPSPNTAAPPASHAGNSSGNPFSRAPPAAIPFSPGPAAYSP